MKTSELTGKDLDYWVAKAQGWRLDCTSNYHWVIGNGEHISRVSYTPSTNGGQCHELMQLPSFEWAQYYSAGCLDASYYLAYFGIRVEGPTLNIAICRAFVASVYGEEVSDE